MKLRSYKSEGIILARKNYGEADRIISVYSKDFGRLTLLAKGIRRPRSRKRGHLEIFNLINFQAESSHGFDIITEVEVADNFFYIRRSLKRISLAYYFMEILEKITRESEPNPELYSLIIEYLNRLKSEKKLKLMRTDFVTRLLVLLGYWPSDKILVDPDKKLEEVVERQIYSKRVGKRVTDE